MTFYILLSTVAMLTAVVGCAAIWGYDVVRAREIERESRAAAQRPALQAVPVRVEID